MKIVKILISLFLSLSAFTSIYADDNTYKIIDNNTNFVDYFTDFNSAYKTYKNRKDEFDNLLLLKNDEVILMEYGIVEFDKDITQYHSLTKKEKDYISGSYGIDAAYLDTDLDEDIVYFIAGGDRGYIDLDKVSLIPYETLNVNLSKYETINGYLYHNIKTQLEYEYYSTSLCLDYVPSFMSENSSYFSYDGHYFYDDFYTMIDDYRNEIFDNAINEEPYYNYFQYLPYRSLTNYTCAEVEDYFYNTLGINGRLNKYIDANKDGANDSVNRSELYGNINEFFNSQYLYGTNALMLLSSAIEESSYGKSENTFLKNNLFTNAAYETLREKNNDRYDSIANSIYTHSKYFIGKKYSNYLLPSYCGTFFGDKVNGINKEYTMDQYYGERIASQCFTLDKGLGSKDYNDLTIGIILDTDSIGLYCDENLENRLYKIQDIDELAFVILDEKDNSYLIQADYSNKNDYLYDYDDCVAYISKDAFTYIINEDSMHDYDLNTINYNFNGGEYHGFDELSIKVNKDESLSIVPNKEGREFENYSLVTYEDGSNGYVANYIGVADVKPINMNLYPNIVNSKLLVRYEDGTNKRIDLNNDYIVAYDEDDGDIAISYCGVQITSKVNANTDEISTQVDEAINNNDYVFVKNNIEYLNKELSMSQIRDIDNELRSTNKRNYVIVDNKGDTNVGISGLDLSLDDRRNFSLVEDTYYVAVNKLNAYNLARITRIASGYGFEVVDSYNFDFKFNYQNIDLRGPSIVSINLDEKKSDYVYSVYHIDTYGDVIKCLTTWSNNAVSFVMSEEGDYVLLSKPSVNKYDIADTYENLRIDNMGTDNNKVNIEFMLGLSMILIALIGILVYYNYVDKKEKTWKDYKKSLQKAGTVQEEKQKN